MCIDDPGYCYSPAPYCPGDPCYDYVVSNDLYCCNTEWDDICQNSYSICACALVNCDDGNPCTSDNCINGICYYSPIAPGNDLCVNATEVFCGQTVSGSTTCATDDTAPDCGTAGSANSGVWYSFTGICGQVTLTMCGQANYDTKLSVYSGDCGSLVCVAGDDDFCGFASASQVTFTSSTGINYLILVHGFGSSVGDFSLSVDCVAPVSASLSGLQEVPPNISPATGSLYGTYNTATNLLSISLSFSDLIGLTTAAHLHGPAPSGVNAGVQIPLGAFPSGVTTGNYSNTFALTQPQETEFLSGLWYVNIHTNVYPGGEIRGQLIRSGLL